MPEEQHILLGTIEFLHSMQTLKDYSGIHSGSCLVMGTGPSLNTLLETGIQDNLTTIGVNNIGGSFHPDYVVVADPIGSFQKRKLEMMKDYKMPFFTPSPEGWDNVFKSPLVSYRFAGYDIESDFGSVYGSDFVNVGHTSVFCALVIASYLGFERIGLIGCDITACGHSYDTEDNHRHELSRILNRINKEFVSLNRAFRQNGIEVFNLSDISAVTAFPKIPINEF